MTEPEQNLSRRNRKKGRNRANKILNLLIVVVVVLIILTASMIFLNNGGDDEADEKEPITSEETNGEGNDTDKEDNDLDPGELILEDREDAETPDDTESDVSEEPGIITYKSSDDKVVAETIIDTSWEPIGTTQTGEHVSRYDGKSADWNEKRQALAYATGLPLETMEFWKIKNGGGPQKSIGIVSSGDKTEMYRVYLEWVDEEGWMPVRMDVLTTLDFDY